MGEDKDRITKLEKRIAELAEMLNRAGDEAKLQVDDERDACVRQLQFFVDTAKKNRDQETTPEGIGTDHYIRALEQGITSLEARKDPGVRWVSEMAHGTKLGEFIQEHVEQGIERGIREWQGRLRKAAEKAIELIGDDSHPASGTLRGALDTENEGG